MVIIIYFLLLLGIGAIGLFVMYLNKRQHNISKLRLDALEKKISASGEGKRLIKKDEKSKAKNFIYDFIDKLKFLGVEMEEKQVILLLTMAYLVVFLLIFLVTKNLIVSLFGGFIGIIIPNNIVKTMIKKRRKAFINLFGDTLALMSNTLKSGFGFRQALQLIADEMPHPICDEFSKLTQEISWGLPLPDAMENMVKRIPDENMQLFATAVIIQNEVGGSLADIISKIALAIKQKEDMKKELSVLLSQGKMSGIVIGGMPFALGGIFYLVSPDYISLLWSTGIFGYAMMGVAMFSEAIGLFMIKGITKVD